MPLLRSPKAKLLASLFKAPAVSPEQQSDRIRFMERGGWGELMGNGEHVGSLGLARIARFEIGRVPLAPLSLALLVPFLVGILLA